MKRFVTVLLFTLVFHSALSCQEEKEAAFRPETFFGTHIFSFDLGYMRTGLLNNGWGLGVTYEQQVFNWFSVRGSFSHMTLWPKNYDITITTEGISMDMFFYPFNRGLEWLYMGCGMATEFFQYSGDDAKNPDDGSEHTENTAISVCPELGWKQNFMNYVLMDVFFGYRIILNDPDFPVYATGITKSGAEYGIKIKVNLRSVLNLVFRR